MFANLTDNRPPLALISQYMPDAYAAVRNTDLTPSPANLVIAHIGATLDAYHAACTVEPEYAYV
jgi:D-tagatose-1,6-bisphosphate aldolase subunit GatZ/KbaZ